MKKTLALLLLSACLEQTPYLPDAGQPPEVTLPPDAAPDAASPDAGPTDCDVVVFRTEVCHEWGECEQVPTCTICSPIVNGRCTLSDGVLRTCTSACREDDSD